MKITFLILTFLGFGWMALVEANEAWKSFELRYYSDQPKANGETDFRGKTEFFDTDQRIDYLKTYERLAGRFFKNPDWDQLVVPDEEAQNRLTKIKPQPLPTVRHRQPLESWRWLGYKPGLIQEEIAAIDQWEAHPGAEVRDGRLRMGATALKHPMDPQTWRFMMRWEAAVDVPNDTVFTLGNVLKTGFLKDGTLFYESKDGPVLLGRYETGTDYNFEVDVDLENSGFNLSINGTKVADFVPAIESKPVSEFGIVSDGGVTLNTIYGEGYQQAVFTEDTNSRDVPYSSAVLFDEDFIVRPDIENWMRPEYDDSAWVTCQLPHPHGGMRFKEESLYLRKWVKTGDYTVAELNIETLNPGGEIWVNGEIAYVQHNALPVKMDISKFLKKHTDNLIAIRVFPNKVDRPNRHTATNKNMLIETRAKGGNLLLNVGPEPSGVIPFEQERLLRELGLWIFINEEAVYRVRPWHVTHEGDVWFTRSADAPNTVYAYLTVQGEWKRGHRKNFVLKSVKATAATQISVLGHDGVHLEYEPKTDASPKFIQKNDGLHLDIMLAQRIYNNSIWPNPVVVKLTAVEHRR
jgi:hypothetical protein